MGNQKEITIISYVPHPAPHGLSVRVSGITQTLKKRGVKCHVICPRNKDNQPMYHAGSYIHPISMPYSLSNSTYGSEFRGIALLIFFIRAFFALGRLALGRMMVLMFEHITSLPLLLLSKVIFRKTIIVDDLNLLHPDYDFAPKRVLLTLDLLSIRVPNAISTGSTFTEAVVKQVLPKKHVIFLPNGVQVFSDQGEGVPGKADDIRILVVGNLTFHQNRIAIENLLDAIRGIGSVKRSFVVEIVGGPLEFVAEHLKDPLVHRGIVRFLGFVTNEQLIELHRSSHIGVLPFFHDTPLVGGQRLKALEYLANGLLVISGPEGVGNITGLEAGNHYVLTSDMPTLIKTLHKAIDDISAFEKIRHSGQKFVRERYSWHSVTEDFWKYFQTL
jgi:glycosyltransferase involved in cell wall biosynthesis